MKILYKGRNLIWLQVLLVIGVAWMSTVAEFFLSIDCGSDRAYFDNVTGIHWETDAKYISTGSNINGIKVYSDDGFPIPNFVQAETLRYFDDPRGRDCYVLPVVPGETYLLRVTFFYGSVGDGSNPIYVEVWVDNNFADSFNWNAGVTLYASYELEFIYTAPKNQANVCLIHDSSPTFISSLELRKLSKTMYGAALGTSLDKFLLMEYRLSSGTPFTGPVLNFLRALDNNNFSGTVPPDLNKQGLNLTNLVSLVGYCEEGNQQILVYVYVSNGTLNRVCSDKSRKSLVWRTRVDLALNAAKGLEYLHTYCNPRIIHRDVKSSNILVDENLIAKVADFGISKQAPEGIFSGVDTLVKGTPGYFDPEYFITQRLTQKSDVYSFGVVLLEIITGRHPHITDLPDGTSETLVQWVRRSASKGSLMDIVDRSLNGQFNQQSMMKAISLAVKSIDQTTSQRPDMKQVVRTLTEAVELELYSEIIQKSNHDTDASIAEDEDEGSIESFPATEETTISPLSGTSKIDNQR